MNSNSITERLAKLSPAKRALLEQRLKDMDKGLDPTPGWTLPRRQSREFAALSFAQQRLWFLNQLEPESPAYNESRVLRLRGVLDLKALEQAFNHIVARHEVLRTTIAQVDENPVQKIVDHRTIELPLIDLRCHATQERETGSRRLVSEVIRRPFDLSRDLMLRALLVQLGDQEHILVIVKHHIGTDGWSSAIFWQELAAAYDAFVLRQIPFLQDLPVQYADYAAWQREWLQGDVLENQLSYWRRQLNNLPVLQLATDRPRPAIQSYRGARGRLTFPNGFSHALKALSRSEGVTLFMTVLAAFQTLLYRYTGQKDVAIGSPISGRNRLEIEGLIGFFANTLVLRTDVSGDPTFRELLGRVRETCLDAYSHQDLPFEKLVEELHPERHLNHNPLFQVMFQLNSGPRHSPKLLGLEVEELDFDSGISKFDLRLSVADRGENFGAQLEYNTDLFDGSTINRLLSHFETLLAGIVADPDRRISDLPLMTEREKHQILVQWNQTERELPKEKCVHDLFEEQVERKPDSVAVVFEDQEFTYAELNRRANQVAHYLNKQGVGPEVLVGLCVERSLEAITGLLGILKAGGGYVPLDPSYPKERISFMLEDSRAKVLLTQKKFGSSLIKNETWKVADDATESSLLDSDTQLICLNREWSKIAEGPADRPGSQVTAANLAYVIYTSGSTGVPKGVAMEHRPLVNLLSWQSEQFPNRRAVRTLQFAPLSFDVSFQEIFATLCCGGTLILISETERRDFRVLLRRLKEQAVERIFLPFVALQELAEAAQEEGGALERLGQVITAGEPLQITRAVAAWFARMPQCRLYNQYGPTESHVVTAFELVGPPADWPALPPIGRPIANSKIYLLDAYRQPVPVSVTGQLYIGGETLARDYWNKPEVGEEKFIPDPFTNHAGARLYRTGDLARYLPDGNIQFLGRIDKQVKIRGFRVEPGEIEAQLGQHAGVLQCVVTTFDDASGRKCLVAYIVSGSERPTAQQLREFLGEKLPEYMIPSAFVYLDALALTASGKIDREGLPAPDGSRPDLAAAYTAPQTRTEELLASVWTDVLKLDKVGIHDNFFELGGHSLLATRVVSRIREIFRIELALRALFEMPTVAALAANIEKLQFARSGQQRVSEPNTDQREKTIL